MMTQLTIDLFNRCVELRGNVNLDEMHNCLDCCKDLLTTLLYEPPMTFEPKDQPEYARDVVPMPVVAECELFDRRISAHISLLSQWCKERSMTPEWRRKNAERILKELDGAVPVRGLWSYLDAYLAAHHPEG